MLKKNCGFGAEWHPLLNPCPSAKVSYYNLELMQEQERILKQG